MMIYPREVIRAIVEFKPDLNVFTISAAFGVSRALNRAVRLNVGDYLSPNEILGLLIPGGALSGIMYVYVLGYLIYLSRRFLGGISTFQGNRAAIAWSFVPVALTVILWLPLIIFFGEDLFSSVTISNGSSNLFQITYSLFVVLEIIAGFWSMALLVVTLSEVNQYSKRKAFVGLVIAIIGYVILSLLIGIVLNPDLIL